jgi:hypothetical protein
MVVDYLVGWELVGETDILKRSAPVMFSPPQIPRELTRNWSLGGGHKYYWVLKKTLLQRLGVFQVVWFPCAHHTYINHLPGKFCMFWGNLPWVVFFSCATLNKYFTMQELQCLEKFIIIILRTHYVIIGLWQNILSYSAKEKAHGRKRPAYANQFGFHAHPSMTHQCMRLTDHVTLNFNSKMSMAPVF